MGGLTGYPAALIMFRAFFPNFCCNATREMGLPPKGVGPDHLYVYVEDEAEIEKKREEGG